MGGGDFLGDSVLVPGSFHPFYMLFGLGFVLWLEICEHGLLP